MDISLLTLSSHCPPSLPLFLSVESEKIGKFLRWEIKLELWVWEVWALKFDQQTLLADRLLYTFQWQILVRFFKQEYYLQRKYWVTSMTMSVGLLVSLAFEWYLTLNILIIWWISEENLPQTPRCRKLLIWSDAKSEYGYKNYWQVSKLFKNNMNTLSLNDLVSSVGSVGTS